MFNIIPTLILSEETQQKKRTTLYLIVIQLNAFIFKHTICLEPDILLMAEIYVPCCKNTVCLQSMHGKTEVLTPML